MTIKKPNKPNKNKQNNVSKSAFPFVSICTPTFNRRPFIPYLIKCFHHQTYPKEKIEWIIIDDGSDPIEDLVKDIPQVKYFHYKETLLLGKKRNIMHSKCSGDIIIYMDDDDYYPPERVSHAVETLVQNPTFLIAGSSEMHIYFHDLQAMYQCGPYGNYHSTAASFAFRKELLLRTSYNEKKALAEEMEFLEKYTIPLKQLEVKKTILVFSHSHNSFDKKLLLQNPQESKVQASPYLLGDFVQEEQLKQFYSKDLHELLEHYEPGKPDYKPHVLNQIKEIQENRNQRKEEHRKKMELQNLLSNINTTTSTSISTNINSKLNTNINTDTTIFAEIDKVRNQYEKQLSEKSYLINELLKKVKDLTVELDKYKLKEIQERIQ